MNSYRLPEVLGEEISELAILIKKFKDGNISAAELKAHRVPFGIYEQRENNTYMVRIRCAAGVITPLQLEKIADLTSRYGSKRIHLTTRQELQIHYVKLQDLILLMKELKEIGLASRGGGGNTVRNIIAPEDGGISINEVFNVAPYAIELTSYLIAENDSWTLPRKFKIAFSGSAQDKGYATIADLGFIAQIRNGRKGFKVYVAGGLGAKSQTANLLFEFIPDSEIFNIARAVKSLFWKYGNRKNKHKARLRFLWNKLGEKEFKKRFSEEYSNIKNQANSPIMIEEIDNIASYPDLKQEIVKDVNNYDLWKSRFVRPQKQKGLFSIFIPMELGFIEYEVAKKFAKFLKPFGDNVIRMTKDQNFFVRNIAEQYLANFYYFLRNTMSNFNRSLIYDKLLSCAGASTCQLGICLAREATKGIIDRFKKSGLNLDQFDNLKIHISGCPNSCGQHPVADIGFFGKAERNDERLLPAYNIVAGAQIEDGNTKLAEKIGEVSARVLPDFLIDVLKLYSEKAAIYPNFNAYYHNNGREEVIKISERYKDIPTFEKDKNYYFDWGAEEIFSLSKRGMGECSAGLFDLIEIDMKNIKNTREELLKFPEEAEKRRKLLWLMVFYSARVLLITRGEEPKTEYEVFDLFNKHFIHTGLVNRKYLDLIILARTKIYNKMPEFNQQIHYLAERMLYLYKIMDDNLQYSEDTGKQKNRKLAAARVQEENDGKKGDVFKDLRGVACPINFVKVKIELSHMDSGDVLEVWLDDGEPIQNVPRSAEFEGHEILNIRKINNYWSVFIKNGV